MSEVRIDDVATAESVHLAGLDRTHRRDHGITYTPDPIVAHVLDEIFGAGRGPAGATLDPSCGTGVFVKALAQRIADELTRGGADITGSEREEFLDRVQNSVWGLDRDEVAVHVAVRELRSLILVLSPGPLDANFMRRNILVGDFLSQPSSLPDEVTFRHVVGNPPYVAVDRIPRLQRASYRDTFETAYGRIDLYTLFIEQATRILETGGAWCFVTPDKYLSSKSALPLRMLLVAQGSLCSVTLFRSHKVFSNAATVPCVSLWRKGVAKATTVRIAEAEPIEGRDVQITPRGVIDQARFEAGGWATRGRAHASLLDRLMDSPSSVSAQTTRISAGLATGLNDVFSLNADEAAVIEPELVHQAVRGRDVRAYRIDDRRQYLLVPYLWNAANQAELIDLADFPSARRHLSQHKSRLIARHCVKRWGKQWWDVHDPVNLPLHRTPKILVPDVAKTNRFALDPGRVYPHHSVYYLLPGPGMAPAHLEVLLNSSVMEFLIRSSAPWVKDGYVRYRQQFLGSLPLPSAAAVAHQFARMDEASVVPQVFDEQVSDLFGVDHDEVRAALLTTRIH